MKPRAAPQPASSADTMPIGATTPRFSVVVPVYEQWHLVPDLLHSLDRQSVPCDRFEVILVDNASPRFVPPPNMSANTRLLHCEMPGSYAARNYGARQARGDWLVFTDADCLPAPDWLAKLNEGIGRHGRNSLIAGSVEMVGSTAAPGVWEIYDIVKGIPQERYVAHGYAATANFAVSTAVFEALGGFDNRRFSGGDAEFCRRAGAAGYPLALVGEARVGHPARTTWMEIATKARRVKGGQLAAGSSTRRLFWLLRTMIPPVRGTWYFLCARHHPLRHRLIATLVLGSVWAVELAETARLAADRPPERR